MQVILAWGGAWPMGNSPATTAGKNPRGNTSWYCTFVYYCNIAVLNSGPHPTPSPHMSHLVNTPDSYNRLVRSELRAWTVFRLTCSLHSVHCSPSREIRWKFTSLRNIHSWICATQRLHVRTSVTSYTSVNIYNLNSCLAHFNALWMEHIRSLRSGIMAEYPVMSTSQGTYVWIEQTSEAIRETYKMCRAGGVRTGIENRSCNTI